MTGGRLLAGFFVVGTHHMHHMPMPRQDGIEGAIR
jgi:hypothetical protein